MENAGLSRKSAKAITQVVSHAQRELVTKDHLNSEMYRFLWLQTGSNILVVSVVVGLFKWGLYTWVDLSAPAGDDLASVTDRPGEPP